MSANPAYEPSSFQPQPLCYDCRAPLPDDSHFCGKCGRPRTMTPPPRGHRDIDQGKMTPISDEPGRWSPPAAKLTPLGSVRTSNDLPRLPEELKQYHSASRPLDERDSIERLLLHPQRSRSGYTDSLGTLFKNSGPLGKSPEAMIAEYKARSAPQATPQPASSDQQPPRYPPTAVGAATPEPQGWITPNELPDELPSWLKGAKQATPETTDTTSRFLRTSDKPTSVPLGDSAVYRSDPTMQIARVAPKESIYPPLPDGSIPCTTCHGIGTRHERGYAEPCPACKGTGRSPAPIPQPAPSNTAPPTAEETAMVQQLTGISRQAVPQRPIEAETTMTLEQAMAVAPAQQPQGTGPHRFNMQAAQHKSDLRQHVEELVEDFAETMTGVATQADNCISRLQRQIDRMRDMRQRLDWMDPPEMHVLGLTESAGRKMSEQLLLAEEAARDAAKHLAAVDMGADVGIIHTDAWQDNFGSRKKEA